MIKTLRFFVPMQLMGSLSTFFSDIVKSVLLFTKIASLYRKKLHISHFLSFSNQLINNPDKKFSEENWVNLTLFCNLTFLNKKLIYKSGGLLSKVALMYCNEKKLFQKFSKCSKIIIVRMQQRTEIITIFNNLRINIFNFHYQCYFNFLNKDATWI